jgi:hypothetical protein
LMRNFRIWLAGFQSTWWSRVYSSQIPNQPRNWRGQSFVKSTVIKILDIRNDSVWVFLVWEMVEWLFVYRIRLLGQNQNLSIALFDFPFAGFLQQQVCYRGKLSRRTRRLEQDFNQWHLVCTTSLRPFELRTENYRRICKTTYRE